jgi:hypothetical protein
MGADVARIAFAQREYRTTAAIEDPVILARHPLATEMEYNTLFSNESDAVTFGTAVLGLRKLDRWTWSCFVNKENYPSLEIGQTIRVMYPRFGFDLGKNFIIKRIKTDASSQLDELNLFGPEEEFALTYDPYFANVVYLAGYEGSSFADQSSYNHTPTHTVSNGGLYIVTGGKFGTYCIERQATGSGFVSYPDSAAFHLGSGPWTIEGWVYFPTAPGTTFGNLLGQSDTGANQRSFSLTMSSGQLGVYLSPDGGPSTVVAPATWTPAGGTWYYFAFDFDGTAYRSYAAASGVAPMVGKSTTIVTPFNSTAPFCVGSVLNNGQFNAGLAHRLDEVRITKGVCRYGNDNGVTVPTAPFFRS